MSSTTTFTVRPASLRDAKTITELHNATVCEAFKSATPNVPVPVAALEKTQSHWREAIEYAEPQVYVAMDGDRMVGFVGFDRSRDKGTPQTMGEIWAIYVVPERWGTGIGLALWDAAREGLLEEGCTHVTVWLAISNDRALRFHELAGFKREPSSAKTVPVGTARVEEIRLKRALN
ncbi:MAG: GNAT family N-acetyltransferase [Rhodoferax sp.]|nr:GNAT family N-acetyltransferase [Rhodoferax sp.]